MRISGIRVNGFGTLADLEIDDLPHGLTVLHGPNEAGKSTLLDFIRGVLFGFPDRRRARPFHAPLRGGRHGGSLRLVDERGQSFVVERYVESRLPSVTSPDGKLHGAELLQRLVGGADDALFGSVFAFGLGELSSFESLDRDEVRELVFSAGVLGAGRSATHAIRQLEQQRATIVRPRQADARANQLRHLLENVENRLREARLVATRYPSAAHVARQLGEDAATALRQTMALRRRDSELERFLTCLPLVQRRAAQERDLAALGPAETEQERRVLQHANEIRRLSTARSGHDERSAKRDELLSDLAGIDRGRSEVLGELGPGVDLDTVRKVHVGVRERSNSEDLARRANEERAAIVAREEESESALARLRQATAALELAGAEPRPATALEEEEITLEQLRSLLLERDRLSAERAQQSAVERLAAQHRTRSNRVLPSAIGLLVVAIALLGVAAVEVTRHQGALGAVAGALAAIVVVVAGVIGLDGNTKDPETGTDTAYSSSGLDPVRLAARIAEGCGRLGLASEPAASEIDAAVRRLANERLRRTQFDRLNEDVARAIQLLEDVRSRKTKRVAAIAAIERDVAGESKLLGLPPGLSPSGLLQRSA